MSKVLAGYFEVIKKGSQNIAEYGFILSLVLVVTIVVMKTIGN